MLGFCVLGLGFRKGGNGYKLETYDLRMSPQPDHEHVSISPEALEWVQRSGFR